MEQPNLEYINQLSGDNDVFKQKMIGILQRELPIETDTYFLYIKTNNLTQAAQLVHKIKHKVSILGLEKSYYISSNYEENLKNNSLILQNDFEAILTIMNQFVKLL